MPAHKKLNVTPEERERLDRRQARKTTASQAKRAQKQAAGIPLRKKPRPYNYRASTPAQGSAAVHLLVERAVATVIGKARVRYRVAGWKNANPERAQANDHAAYLRNREVVMARALVWGAEHRGDSRKPKAIARERLRGRFHCALKQASASKMDHTFALIGGSFKQLFANFEAQLDGASMQDVEMDHIFPMKRFNLERKADQLKAMHWTNLQPLSPEENQSKSSRLPTKAMAAKVDRSCWPDGVTEDMLPTIYPGWSSPLRM